MPDKLDRIAEVCNGIQLQLARIAYAVEETVRVDPERRFVSCKPCGSRLNDPKACVCAVCGSTLPPAEPESKTCARNGDE